MTNFNQQQFNEFILDSRVIGFFDKPIKLKSGRMSHFYVNWRNVAEDTYLIDELSDYVISFVNDIKIKPDCFYGVPEGATKLGIITQYKWAKSFKDYNLGLYCLPMGRAKPKEHGHPKDKYFVGMPRGKTVIIEDVTTTGGSLLSTIDQLLEADVNVAAAIGLTNRTELRDDNTSVKQAVEAKGVPYYHLSSALELLPLAYERFDPGEAIGRAIEKEFEQYGIEKIQLVK